MNKHMSDFIAGQIHEAVWTVAKTSNPLASVIMDTECADAQQEHAREEARRVGIQVVRLQQNGPPEVVPELLVFYREETMLDVFKFLGSNVARNTIPADIRETLYGLLHGYRTDALHDPRNVY